MSDASTIKEFFVALGFKVDESGRQKFDQAIKKADKGVQGLGQGVAKAAPEITKGLTGIVAGGVALGLAFVKVAEDVARAVVQMARDLDQLYFTSRRVNAAGENIKAFGFAVQQLGGTAQGAQAALEGIASFMRSNPAGEGFIASLGVATRDANGQLRDSESILESLGKQFAAMPFYVAKVRAAMLGIDERTLIAIEDPNFGKESQKVRDFAASIGLGMDSGADASNKFAEKIRDLQAEFGLLAVAVGTRLLPMFQSLADWLSAVVKWFASIKNQQLGRELSAVGQAFGQVAAAALSLGQVIAKDLGPAFSAWINGGLKSLASLLLYVKDIINLIADLLSGKWSAAWKDAFMVFKDGLATLKNGMHEVGNIIAGLWKGITAPSGAVVASDANGATGLGAPGVNPQGSADGSDGPIPQNRPGLRSRIAPAARQTLEQIRAFFVANGFSAAQAQGIEAGVAAEGGDVGARNPTSGAFGIGQWLGSRQRALFAQFGPNPTLAEQLQFMLQELRGGDRGGAAVRSAVTALSTMSAYVTSFMRPGAGAMGDLERGYRYLGSSTAMAAASGAPSINQRTEINISGTHDPERAGRVVAASQDRVNGNLIRNLKTAFA